MCFTDGQDKTTPNLINGKSHILEVIRPKVYNREEFNSFQDALFLIKDKLTGPESTLISRTLFNKKYYVSNSQEEQTHEEKIYGTILYREEESTLNCSWFRLLLQDFNNYQIKKVFNMTLPEYLELSPYEKILIDDVAIEILQATQKEVERLERQNDTNFKKVKGELDLDSIEEEL